MSKQDQEPPSTINFFVDDEEKEVKLYIRGEIGDVENYLDVFIGLRESAKTYPTVVVDINTPGGDAITMTELLNILEEFEFMVTIGTGQVASAGFIIWCSGDYRVVEKNTLLMAHRESYARPRAKTYEHLAFISVLDKMYKKLLSDYCGDVLTEEEMKLAETTEVFILSDDALERGICVDRQEYDGLGKHIIETIEQIVLVVDLAGKDSDGEELYTFTSTDGVSFDFLLPPVNDEQSVLTFNRHALYYNPEKVAEEIQAHYLTLTQKTQKEVSNDE